MPQSRHSSQHRQLPSSFAPAITSDNLPQRSSLSQFRLRSASQPQCLFFRAMKQNSGVTSFFKAATALAIVGLGVYVEFNTATRIIIWLAARSR